MIEKETFVVRVGGSEHCSTKEFKTEGTIFPAFKKHFTEAYYNKYGSISPFSFRFATKEEIEAYHKGMRNIKDIEQFKSRECSRSILDNFSVFLAFPKQQIEDYKELCVRYGIKQRSTWQGTGNIYGIQDKKIQCTLEKVWGKEFSCLSDFKVFLSKHFLDKDNFIIRMPSLEVYKEYEKLCKQYSLKYTEGLRGILNYYGVYEGKVGAWDNIKDSSITYNMEEFKRRLNNLNTNNLNTNNLNTNNLNTNKNEKKRIIKQEPRGSISGRTIGSNPKRQVASSVRYTGNKVKSVLIKTKSCSIKISSSAVAFRCN